MRFIRAALCVALALVVLLSSGCVTSKTQMVINSLLEEMKRNPEDPEVHAKLAQSYLVRYDETKNPGFLYTSANELKEAIRLKPDFHWAHCALGRVYAIQGKEDLAFFEAKEAVRLDPDCPRSRNLLGTLYTDRGYSDGACFDDEMNRLAIAEFKEAVRLDPDNNYPHSLLATLYSRKGLYELAVFEQKEAVRLSPTSENRRLLGRAFAQSGDLDAAIGELQGVLRQDPKLARIDLNLAYMYFVAGKYEESLNKVMDYRKFTRWLPPTDSALFQYMTMKRLGRNAEARKMLSDYAAAYRGKDWEIKLVQHFNGTLDEQQLLAGARQKCDLAVAYYFLGYDSFLKGDRKKAAGYFQKTLDTEVFGFVVYTAARAMLESPEMREAAKKTGGAGK